MNEGNIDENMKRLRNKVRRLTGWGNEVKAEQMSISDSTSICFYYQTIMTSISCKAANISITPAIFSTPRRQLMAKRIGQHVITLTTQDV